MLLLLNIGNTNTTIALCEADRVGPLLSLKTDRTLTGEECARTVAGFMKDNQVDAPEGSVICSVVPEITPVYTHAVRSSSGTGPLIISHDLKTGLEFHINNAEGLGADRIATAAAARKLYDGNDLIIVDIGTATTVCVIEGNKYMGGAIMPGPGISADALSERTSKLPRVALRPPESIIGKDTAGNILSGIILGQAGAIDRIVSEIKSGISGDATVIATGGFAELMTPYINADSVDPLLIFKGMSIIYKMNF